MKHRKRAALSALFAFSVLGLTACGSEPAAEQPVQGGGTAQAGVAQAPAAPPATPAPPAGASGGPARDDAPKGTKKEGSGARPIETARLAYEKTTEARSAKVTMMMEFSGLSQGDDGPDGFGARMDGIVDFERDLSVFSMDVPSLGPIKMRQVGSDLYEKFPEPLRSEIPGGKPWIKVDLDEFAGGRYGAGATELKDGAPTSLDGQLEYLRGVSDSVQELGPDPVRGVPTTRYRARVDLADAAAGGDQKTEQAFRTLRDQVGAEKIWVEIWVDADGRLRRSTMDVPMENLGSAPGSDEVRMRIEQEFYDFGAPVSVEPPPADQTVEIRDLEELARAASS